MDLSLAKGVDAGAVIPLPEGLLGSRLFYRDANVSLLRVLALKWHYTRPENSITHILRAE